MQLVDVMGNTDDPMGYDFSDGDPDACAVLVPGTLASIPGLPRPAVWPLTGGSETSCKVLPLDKRDQFEPLLLWLEASPDAGADEQVSVGIGPD